MKNYEETIKYLFSMQKFGIKLGLTNIKKLLQKLGSPHEQYRTVHIAGTNGKGSTAATLESILMKAGYRVGLYTSPHLVDFRERFRVNGKEIDEESVVELTNLVREKKDALELDIEITFFEYTTALAFTYFAKEKVDIAIIEAGMGGRLDATNVLTPMVSVITSISKEHEQYLGDSTGEIAFEKAGIIKKGVPVVYSVKDTEADIVITDIAKSKGAKCYKLGDDFRYSNAREDTFDYEGINSSYKGLKKALKGPHQFANTSLALAVIELIGGHGFVAEEACVRDGILDVKWPGRFEKVSDSPLIILDGAHNVESIDMALGTLKETYPEKKVIAVLGVMRDKDISGILKRIEKISDKVILTKPEIFRSAEPKELLRFFENDEGVECTESVGDAVALAKSKCGNDSLIFVTGSLFTVGDAKKYFIKNTNRV